MKLLIIRAGALGDTLMLMPLISALSREHEIIILGRKPGIDYLEPYVGQCIDIERGGWHRIFIRGSDIDISFPQVNHVIAYMDDRDNIIYGNLNHMFSGSKIDIFQPFPDPGSKTHVAIHMLRDLQASGVSVNPEKAFNEALNKPLMPSGKDFRNKILFHPGSGSKKKNYSPDFWFDLFTRLKKDGLNTSRDIFFLLGPAEEDILPIMEEKAGELGAETVIPGKKELLSILNDTCLYIGHDSGVTHLAAMLGVNTVALFKESSVEQWHPLGPFVRIIQNEENENKVLKKVLSEINSLL